MKDDPELAIEANFFGSLNAKGTILIAPAMGITAQYYHHLAAWLRRFGK